MCVAYCNSLICAAQEALTEAWWGRRYVCRAVCASRAFGCEPEQMQQCGSAAAISLRAWLTPQKQMQPEHRRRNKDSAQTVPRHCTEEGLQGLKEPDLLPLFLCGESERRP